MPKLTYQIKISLSHSINTLTATKKDHSRFHLTINKYQTFSLVIINITKKKKKLSNNNFTCITSTKNTSKK